MGSLAVTADRIVRQAANTIPGNATGAEAACQSLTPSQVRDFLGMATTSDVTFDIVRATTSVQTPLVNNASAALTLGNSTYGVTVPGAATFSGTVTATSPAQFTSGFIAKGAAIDLSWGGGIDFAANNGTVYGSIRSSNVGPALIQTATRFSGHVTFNANNTYDIGDGTYDPQTVRAATSVLTPLVNNASAALTLGNSTYGVTVPGAATFSGTVTATSPAQFTSGFIAKGAAIDLSWGGGIDFTANNGTVYGSIRSSNVSPGLLQTGTTFSGDISMSKTSAQGYVRAYATDGVKNFAMYHDGTNGILSTSSGNLNLTPAGGTVAVTGGITASGVFSLTANYQDLADGVNIVCGTTTGAKLATGATQKLSFWGVTPVVQPASANQAALSLDSDVTGGDTVDKAAVDANFAAIQTLVNQLRSDLVAAGIIKGAA